MQHNTALTKIYEKALGGREQIQLSFLSVTLRSVIFRFSL